MPAGTTLSNRAPLPGSPYRDGEYLADQKEAGTRIFSIPFLEYMLLVLLLDPDPIVLERQDQSFM